MFCGYSPLKFIKIAIAYYKGDIIGHQCNKDIAKCIIIWHQQFVLSIYVCHMAKYASYLFLLKQLIYIYIYIYIHAHAIHHDLNFHEYCIPFESNSALYLPYSLWPTSMPPSVFCFNAFDKTRFAVIIYRRLFYSTTDHCKKTNPLDQAMMDDVV